MKKNKTMRAAGGLLIATMLTSSIVSGTYAKYVTSDNAEDSARVAKFGVTVTASGSLFDMTYLAGEGNTPGGTTTETDANTTVLTVESSDNVVAPGTKNTDGLTFAVAGTPEVDVQLTVAVDDTLEEVFLKGGADVEYPDMTTGADNDEFALTEDYYPVKFTLTQGTTKLVNGGKLSAVEAALEGLSKRYDAGTDLSAIVGTLNLTWEWAYEGNDKADTLLGDLAAQTTLAPVATLTDGTDYNLKENIKITVTVTQID